MRRILPCVQDAYITSKIIGGVRVTDANTGQAGTIDLYKLYNETRLSGTVAPVETSRALLKFDLSSLSSDIVADASFKCFMQMNDIYGGQPVPSNYTLSLVPLAKEFQEGRGSDVLAYRDVDAANWLSSSVGVLWTSGGAGATGTLGTSGLDCYVSGTLNPSIGSVPLWVTQSFTKGDENLLLDVTTLVSGVVVGLLPSHGFRLSFASSLEEDQTTYFVKRFASRHSRNPFAYPRLDVYFDDSKSDSTLRSFFNYPNKLYTYNAPFGAYRDFYSGSYPMSGSTPIQLTLVASKSINVLTTSWSSTHSASISHLTSSVVYFSSSFVAARESAGIYFATFSLDANSDMLSSYLGRDTETSFLPLWQSLDGTTTFTSASYFPVKKIQSTTSNVVEHNFMVNVTNLKYQYSQEEVARLRVFIQDFNTDLRHNMIPVELVSEVYSNMHWRLRAPYSQTVLIPFDTTYNSTKLSSDGQGMYFDIHMEDLALNQIYEFEFMVRENGKDYFITNQGFRFKVVP